MKLKWLQPRRCRHLWAAGAGVWVLLAWAGIAHADYKPFAYTYPTKTALKGRLELEHYLDMGFQAWDDPDTDEKESDWTEVDWQHQLEFEYGITDAFDMGFYNVFKQKPFGDFTYEGVKLRARYNFGQGRKLPIDPGLYLEVGYFGDTVKIEEMFILGKRWGIFETSLNLKAEQEIEFGGDETEYEYEAIISYAAGFHVHKHTAISLEYYGKAKIEHGELAYFVNYLGPTLHLAVGRFYWNLAVQPQLGDRATLAAFRVRSLFSVLF